jgi:hypothetical protein
MRTLRGAKLPFLHSVIFVALSLATGAAAYAQSTLDLGGGLTIPDARTPWVVETFQKHQQLVPIHHSTVAVNKHTGANIAGSLAGSFLYKPKLTTELDGVSSRNQLHTRTPVFYLLVESDPDSGGESKNSVTFQYAIVRTVPLKDRRIVDHLTYTQLTGNAKHSDDLIDTNMTQLPSGWIRIEPRTPMPEGEYCLLPIPSTKGTYSTAVYDFGIHADAPNEKDVVVASAP